MPHINTKEMDFQPGISVIIYTYNSAEDISECIESAHQLTSNITIIDLESRDKSIELAEKEGAKVVSHPFTRYVETVREFGIELGNTEWLTILDADERITKELADEIRTSITSDEFTHYKIPRKEYFARKTWLQYGGWWPNYLTGRLFKKNAFKQWPKNIHSSPLIDGNEGYLKSALLHYSKNDYQQIVAKTINFEDIESDLLFKANKRVATPTFFRKFFGELYRRMFKWQGYKDGTIGIIESIYQAFSKTITYIYLYEKQNSRPL